MRVSSTHSPSVLVTGASSGIGWATAALFATRGWQVYGTSRDPEGIPPERRLPGVRYVALENGDPASVHACAASVRRVDVLVNNAGQSLAGPLEHTDDAALESLFRINVLGPVALTRALLPRMREQGGGRVIFVGSLAAEFPVPFQSAYAASKLALRGFVTALRAEVAPYGVSATLVQPGYFRSDIHSEREWHCPADSDYAPQLARVAAAIDANHRRAGDPAQVAEAIWALARTRHPPLVRSVGSHGPTLRFIRRFVPDRTAERLVVRSFTRRPSRDESRPPDG